MAEETVRAPADAADFHHNYVFGCVIVPIISAEVTRPTGHWHGWWEAMRDVARLFRTCKDVARNNAVMERRFRRSMAYCAAAHATLAGVPAASYERSMATLGGMLAFFGDVFPMTLWSNASVSVRFDVERDDRFAFTIERAVRGALAVAAGWTAAARAINCHTDVIAILILGEGDNVAARTVMADGRAAIAAAEAVADSCIYRSTFAFGIPEDSRVLPTAALSIDAVGPRVRFWRHSVNVTIDA